MDTFKDLEVRPVSGGTWFTSASFEVVETERIANKSRSTVKEVTKFKGTIEACKAYVYLKEKGLVKE